MKLMGTPSKVFKAREKLEHIGRQDEKEAHMYDAGMVAVLKFVAAKILYGPQGALTTEIEWSDSSLETQHTVNELYEKLEGFLSNSNDLAKLLQDLDSAHAAKASFEIEDAFVTGFVAGFRYLMDEAAYSKNVNFLK
ncbi:hypothetical protein [Bacillus pumilus]|uniref:Uncharacterized protein n=1 Tax=Bacillus pumilus TaxID=1408 RepID=A0AB34R0Z8_BACPU|nr:hypothetical protein [Bacillus pumilus]KIL22447.1 hypothetical protein B4127_1389 [Bacillus pumilus]MBU8609390.1 hypothetical protein [Bacillus pumilus]MED1111098.1 hypothetical protein [Bacillus pumilus]RAP08771.1 hypothetical protein C2W58_00827 [Bacillus pumilus]HBU89863.1 hypothetical protein [Bacillus pumilus]